MRIGLALSGGGFRATLYHLGMIRYLHDANLLRSVSHITSVSGGSVLAAHLALNWERHCGDSKDFEVAASELLDFVRLDVRNRIMRRYPLALVASTANRLARSSRRPLNRTMLLEQHYATGIQPNRYGASRHSVGFTFADTFPYEKRFKLKD